MTRTQFDRALAALGLTTREQAATALGLTKRQVQRLAAGNQKVSETIALLLAMYRQHGIPKELRQ